MVKTLKNVPLSNAGLLVAGMLSVCTSTWAQVAVLQSRNDPAGTGTNLSEITLHTSNVSPSAFGRLFSYPVDGEIVAQPLYVPNVAIPGKGVHNVLYVATMGNGLYAFDADNPNVYGTGKLWAFNFNQRAGPGVTPFRATEVTGVRSENFPVGIGILSTPVIDAASSTLYVVVSTMENGAKVMRLHAVDIATGNERLGSPIVIQGTYSAGDVTLVFNPEALNQRAALVLANNQVIIAFSSYNDIIPYRGWVLAYDKDTLLQTGVFVAVTTANNYGGGIWQVGRAPAVDTQGRVYLTTGNALKANGYDGINNFSESILCLDPARGLQLVDWFTAGNWAALDRDDLDLGRVGSGADSGNEPARCRRQGRCPLYCRYCEHGQVRGR